MNMQIPETVYHGTFWPNKGGTYPKHLKTPFGYVSTTTNNEWGHWAARNKRFFTREKEGCFLLYVIDTEKLPKDVRETCIPPGNPDPRANALDDDEWRKDRIEMEEWWFTYIPKEAIVNVEKRYVDDSHLVYPY
jgi:hypothetical protein